MVYLIVVVGSGSNYGDYKNGKQNETFSSLNVSALISPSQRTRVQQEIT
jgi:hypothetical protein